MLILPHFLKKLKYTVHFLGQLYLIIEKNLYPVILEAEYRTMYFFKMIFKWVLELILLVKILNYPKEESVFLFLLCFVLF